MARKNYKVNESIKVVYQAPDRESGLTDIKCDVFNAIDDMDVVQSGYLVEIGLSGRYKYFFTPDVEGDWSVQIVIESTGEGAVTKHYSVGQYNIQEIGANLQSVELKVDQMRSNMGSPPMIG